MVTGRRAALRAALLPVTVLWILVVPTPVRADLRIGNLEVFLNDSLRFADEFVRHKILDLVGDLAVLGRPVIGHVVGRNAGHALNHQLVLAIQKSCAIARHRATARSRAGVRRQTATAPSAQGLLPGIAAI